MQCYPQVKLKGSPYSGILKLTIKSTKIFLFDCCFSKTFVDLNLL